MQRTAGNRLLNVVVADEGVAQRCIDALLAANGGRLTFMPLTQLRPHVVTLPDTERDHAYAMTSLVKARDASLKDTLAPAIQSVWGRCYLARDADAGARIARAYYVEAVLNNGDKARATGYVNRLTTPVAQVRICSMRNPGCDSMFLKRASTKSQVHAREPDAFTCKLMSASKDVTARSDANV
jgi:chromosome segregation ATPase